MPPLLGARSSSQPLEYPSLDKLVAADDEADPND